MEAKFKEKEMIEKLKLEKEQLDNDNSPITKIQT